MDTTEVEDVLDEIERDECWRAILDTVATCCNLIVSTIATCDLLFLFTFITGKPLSKLIIDPLLDLCFFFSSDLLFSHSSIGSIEVSLPIRLLSSSSSLVWKKSRITLPISPTPLRNNDLNGKSSCVLESTILYWWFFGPLKLVLGLFATVLQYSRGVLCDKAISVKLTIGES